MHHALHIEEILLNILGYLHKRVYRPELSHRHYCYANAHVARLARTCKAFKEPALDMIWAELDDLTPLVRCLPGGLFVYEPLPIGDGLCSLRKHLEQEDWDIILCYAHRIRALPCLKDSLGLATDCIQALSKPPSSSTESFFSNLRVVGLYDTKATITPLIPYLINPKVTDISFKYIDSLGSALDGFGGKCPFMTDFCVLEWAHGDMISSFVCHWGGLRSVRCWKVGLNADALSHLSRLPSMLQLSFQVDSAVVDQVVSTQSSPSLLSFSALHDLRLGSANLSLIGRLFHHFRFQALHELSIGVPVQPTASDLMTFLAALQEACVHHTLTYFLLNTYRDNGESILPFAGNFRPYHITFDRLRLLTVFANMKSITLDTHCGVDINERELLSLASSWPHLEKFEVGKNYDWTPSSAITPDGFLRLLERCRSLRVLYFGFDARGFTEIPQGHPWCGLKMPTEKGMFLHFHNSPIEEESVEALGVFFHVAPYPEFNLSTHWNNRYFRGSERPQELCDLYYDRWVRARGLAYDLWKKRRDLRLSIETRASSSELGCTS